MSNTHEYRGLTIKVWHDNYTENPRQWCNMGTLALTESAWADVTISGQADLFTKLLAMEDYATWEPEYQDYDYYNVDENKARRKLEENYIILPVYKYDHGGVCYNTSGFSCPWDSGQVGFIYVSKEAVREEFNVKRISPKLRKHVENCLSTEVKTFSDCASGNVWGFTVYDEDGEILESCGGFIGDSDDEYMMDEARREVDYHLKNKWKERIEQLKTFIRNGVPLSTRLELL